MFWGASMAELVPGPLTEPKSGGSKLCTNKHFSSKKSLSFKTSISWNLIYVLYAIKLYS
jgi:hypothetical protein